MEQDTQKKREIRQTALQLFKESGYDSVTLNDICRAAGISKNTFYYYFSSKDALIMDLFRVPVTLSEENMVKIMSISDPYEQLQYTYRLMVDYMKDLGREIVKKALVANLSRVGTVERPKACDHAHKPNPYMEMLKCIYAKAAEIGEVRSDVPVERLLKLTIALYIGCVQIWATAPMELDLEKMYFENLDPMLKIQDGKEKEKSR